MSAPVNKSPIERNRPRKLLKRWDPGHPFAARHLNEAVDAINDMATGVPPPRQIYAMSKAGVTANNRIVCACATHAHFDFTFEPSTPGAEGIDLTGSQLSDIFYETGKAWVLVWMQRIGTSPDPDTNGVYSYDPSQSDSKLRWQRILPLDYDNMGEREIYVTSGRRWSRMRFHYNIGFELDDETQSRDSDYPVLPIFDRPYPVHHGTYETSDSRSGLGALADSYVPSAGDMIWVRANGLYVASASTWRKIATATTGSESTPDPTDYAVIRSDLEQRLTSISCVDSDVEGVFTWNENSIRPTLLSEAP